MTLKQKQFAEVYVKNECNAQIAAQKVSASPITKSAANSKAQRYLNNQEVQDYIEELGSDAAARAGISIDWLLRKYKKLYRSAIAGDARYDSSGEILDYKPDRSAAKGALDSISKVCGFDAPTKIDVNVDLSVWLTQQIEKKEIIDVKEIE